MRSPGLRSRHGAVRLLLSWRLVSAAVPCLYQEHRELDGTIWANGGGQYAVTQSNQTVWVTCHKWAVRPGKPIASCRLENRGTVLANGDSLLVMVGTDLFAAFTAAAPVPGVFEVKGYHNFELQFLTHSLSSQVLLEFFCAAKEQRGLASNELDAVVAVSAVALLGSLACACGTYVFCLILANRRLERAIESSRLLMYSEMQQQSQRRQAIEQRTMEELWALPVRTWDGIEAGRDGGEEECCLCLEAYSFDDKVRVLPCDHFFHQACVDRWFQSRRFSARTCPLCKRDPVADAMATAAPRSAVGLADPDTTPAWAWGAPQQQQEAGQLELGAAASEEGEPRGGSHVLADRAEVIGTVVHGTVLRAAPGAAGAGAEFLADDAEVASVGSSALPGAVQPTAFGRPGAEATR